MDWTQFTFIGGSIVAMLLKQFYFKADTVKRDKLIPILILVANFIMRVAQESMGVEVQVFGVESMTALDDPSSLTQYAALFSWPWIKLPLIAVFDTIMSMGLHRLKRWRDNMWGWTPTAKRKR